MFQTLHQPSTGSERILLVDDDNYVRKIVTKMLKSVGYQVRTASTGAEALELFRLFRDEIDLVLLDLKMPDMNGITIFNAIKDVAPDMKVIFSTGYAEDAVVNKLPEERAGFLQKPYNMQTLSSTIGDVLGQRAARFANL